jgi:hypothetical protein
MPTLTADQVSILRLALIALQAHDDRMRTNKETLRDPLAAHDPLAVQPLADLIAGASSVTVS